MERFPHLYYKGTMFDIFEETDYIDQPLVIAESKKEVTFLVSRSFEIFIMGVDKTTFEFDNDSNILIPAQYTHNFMDAKSILLNKGFTIDWSVYNYYLRCYSDWFKNPSTNVYIFNEERMLNYVDRFSKRLCSNIYKRVENTPFSVFYLNANLTGSREYSCEQFPDYVDISKVKIDESNEYYQKLDPQFYKDFWKTPYDEYEKLSEEEQNKLRQPQKDKLVVNTYGVADNTDQVLEAFSFLKDSPDLYTLSILTVNKSDQSEHGGWRWHKWGEYIGDQEPTTEYLYDEPLIENVICFSLYKVDKKAIVFEDNYFKIVEGRSNKTVKLYHVLDKNTSELIVDYNLHTLSLNHNESVLIQYQEEPSYETLCNDLKELVDKFNETGIITLL